jgi:uncharacterized protein (TIGR02246 family)
MRATLGVGVVLLLFAGGAFAEEPAGAATPEGEPAIRELNKAFVKAFNAGDAKGIAALFTEGAQILEVGDDPPIRGREAIEARFKTLFEEQNGISIALKLDRVDALDPNLIVEQESVTLTLPGDPQEIELSRDSVTYLRANGTWRIARIEDLDPETKSVTPHERLAELEWLIGDWISESTDAVVRTHCAWDEGENYLIRSFTIQVEGERVMTGTQRMGWDPVSRQIKSWVFDSDGGHAEGLWSRDGDRWVIKAQGVRSDGTQATATQVLTKVDNDHARWASVDRTLGAIAVPDIEEFSLVRKPPMPK